MITPKKTDNVVARQNRYLNYGLMSLANSDSARNGSVYHGHFDSPDSVFARIVGEQPEPDRAIFLISCPSYFALEWAGRFAALVRQQFPIASIVFGGRWVVDGNVPALKKLIPQVDLFVEGIAETQLPFLLNKLFHVQYERSQPAKLIYERHKVSVIDYAKLNNSHEFVPSFEASRGCGAGCNFCSEANVKLTPLKPPEILCAEISDYRSAVKSPVDRFYLEASNFTPQSRWLHDFYERRIESGLENIYWRTEARVDIFSERSLQVAYHAGLRVLDIGLESASHTQLLRMSKTKNPGPYLERASKLLKIARDLGISIKVNILLYPGETLETISETLTWLRFHKQEIAGISVYPTVYYGHPTENTYLLNHYNSLGASLVSPERSFGIHHVNLSQSIPHTKSVALSLEISREFMTAESYFQLKSFSYFDPNYTIMKFHSDIIKSDPAQFSFSTNLSTNNPSSSICIKDDMRF